MDWFLYGRVLRHEKLKLISSEITDGLFGILPL